MPKTKKKTTRRKTTDRRKRTSSGNIVGNFRGIEDEFLTRVRDGMIKFLESPFSRPNS